jgi:hypothetical protein
VTPEVLLVAIAGYGLNPSLRLFVEAPLDERAWRALVVELETRQLTALALAAAKAEVLPVTEEQAEDLRFRNAGALARRDAAVQCLTELIGVLNHYAIDSCVLCGAATAALDYQVADLRLYESANVLVPSGQHDQAVTVLQGKGMLQPSAQEPRPRRRRAINFCAANGVAIQLHFTIMPGRYGGTVQTRDLLASRVWFSRRGVRLGALGAEERLLHASIQARLNGTGGDLLAQRDVVQLVLRDDLALRRLERLASSWRLEAVLADAVRRAWDTFAVPDVVPISAWSRSYRPHRRDRRRLAARPPQTAFERGESWGDSGAMDVAPGTGF